MTISFKLEKGEKEEKDKIAAKSSQIDHFSATHRQHELAPGKAHCLTILAINFHGQPPLAVPNRAGKTSRDCFQFSSYLAIFRQTQPDPYLCPPYFGPLISNIAFILPNSKPFESYIDLNFTRNFLSIF